MNKSYKVFISLFIFFLFCYPLKANSQTKIAILNMEFLMEKSLAGKSIKKQLDDLRKKDINSFNWKTPAACAYDSPPSQSLLETPANPVTNIGINTPFIQMKEVKKCNLPSVSLVRFPVNFGNQ